MDNWVDFKAIKEAVSLEAVLEHYGLIKTLRRSGAELRGRCPIHNGEGSDTFHANTQKNAFQCFSCKARGNVLDFVAAMEKCSVRDAGLKLKDWFRITAGDGRGALPAPAATGQHKTGSQLAPEKAGDRGESPSSADGPNKPL
jgi:DNA primase